MTAITQPKLRDCDAHRFYVQTLTTKRREERPKRQSSIERDSVSSLRGGDVLELMPGTLNGPASLKNEW